MALKWEYKLIVFGSDNLLAQSENRLNKAGLKGWEAVGVGMDDAETTVLLKRPLQTRPLPNASSEPSTPTQ